LAERAQSGHLPPSLDGGTILKSTLGDTTSRNHERDFLDGVKGARPQKSKTSRGSGLNRYFSSFEGAANDGFDLLSMPDINHHPL
jgi:hypothetical protein